ncbi:MscL family protein [Nocardioides sp. Bht2]|uniref:MscL family protein n=1 Tax=Nocardioides sp. Bht2 TaxID=3392297 RepID=UPI0039B3F96F
MNLKGFKEFVLKGNLVELAVAFIMAAAFAKVVETFTGVLLGFIGKVGGEPNFDTVEIADVNVGLFLAALVSFLILAAVVFYFVVTPYNMAKERFFQDGPAAKPDDIILLEEIRNLLAQRPGGQL